MPTPLQERCNAEINSGMTLVSPYRANCLEIVPDLHAALKLAHRANHRVCIRVKVALRRRCIRWRRLVR